VSHNFTKFGSCIPENRFSVSLKRESFFIVKIESMLKLRRLAQVGRSFNGIEG
jgi:hypothetical protein